MKLPSQEQILYFSNYLVNKIWFRQGYHPSIKKILVVKWDEIGDMATAVHVFEALKQSYPEAEITVLCKPFVKPLIKQDPHVSNIITSESEFNFRPDAVVELRGSFKTLWLAIRNGVRFRCGRAEVRFKNRGKQLHELQTNFEAVRPLLRTNEVMPVPSLYYSESDEKIVDRFLRQRSIGKFAIIHAGARRQLRQWPPARFREAVIHLQKKHNLSIIFAGVNEDLAVIQEIAEGLDFVTHDFVGDYDLAQFSCLCSKADFYLGNESGPLHIASAFNVPLVALYGPGVPNVFYPVSKQSKVLHHVLECNPCDQIHCVHPDHPCIARIQVDDVIWAIDEILGF